MARTVSHHIGFCRESTWMELFVSCVAMWSSGIVHGYGGEGSGRICLHTYIWFRQTFNFSLRTYFLPHISHIDHAKEKSRRDSYNEISRLILRTFPSVPEVSGAFEVHIHVHKVCKDSKHFLNLHRTMSHSTGLKSWASSSTRLGKCSWNHNRVGSLCSLRS